MQVEASITKIRAVLLSVLEGRAYPVQCLCFCFMSIGKLPVRECNNFLAFCAPLTHLGTPPPNSLLFHFWSSQRP